MKVKLEEEQKRLTNELVGLSAHTEVGSGSDENAEEVEIDEVSQSLIARINSDLEKIALALKKISEGTYGIGDDGKPISRERLEVLPWAERAI